MPVRPDGVQSVQRLQSVGFAAAWLRSVEFEVQNTLTGTTGTISKVYAQLGVGLEGRIERSS